MDAESFAAAWNIRTHMILVSLIILSALAVAATARRAFRGNEKFAYEGFAGAPTFVSKHDADVYDMFYVAEYAAINIPDRHIDVLQSTLLAAHATPATSIILDVGSGTGAVSAALLSRGFAITGIDRSTEMVAYCRTKHPELHVVCDDVLQTMVYEKQSFTHILCLDMTIYEIPDITAFFRNCFFWLKLNGRMILHLADPAKYDPIPAAAKQGFVDDQTQSIATERITETMVDFPQYVYTRKLDFAKALRPTKTETFVDKGASGIARRYQSTLYLASLELILDAAIRAGFTPRGQMRGANGDIHQYFFVLERLM
jgi:2-polyprenyl-3-methyl-5-hydroxy-6-metoxy-1,4-benzoquinol methylase